MSNDNLSELNGKKSDEFLHSKEAIRAEKVEKLRKEQKLLQKRKQQDNFKLLFAILLVFIGFWAYYNAAQYVPNLPSYLNIIYPAVGLLLAILIVFYWCSIGKRLLVYIKESFGEFKKVVWPTRSNAIQTTIFVIGFVSVFAIYIYGVDSFIAWLFSILFVGR